MAVRIDWRKIEDGEGDDAAEHLWEERRVLYAYVHDGEILYVGKAWGTTVIQRWNAEDKGSLFDYIVHELRIEPEQLDVMVGMIETDLRLTRQLLSDLESLLIATRSFEAGAPTPQSIGLEPVAVMMAAWRTVVGTMAAGGRTRAVGRWTGRVTDVRRFTSGANAGAVSDIGDALNQGAATEACRACPQPTRSSSCPGGSVAGGARAP